MLTAVKAPLMNDIKWGRGDCAGVFTFHGRSRFQEVSYKSGSLLSSGALLVIDALVDGQVFESRIDGAGVDDGGVLVLPEVGNLIACWGVLFGNGVSVLCSCVGCLNAVQATGSSMLALNTRTCFLP